MRSRPPQPRTSAPVVVAGMHRSGTSLAASLLAAGGVDMGDLIPADRHNPRGYFEDRDFQKLNRRILGLGTPEDENGHRDWGWTESGAFRSEGALEHLPAARALLETRRQTGSWGWKDPRNALLLDFWDEAVGDGLARYVLLYRYPWDVADSMQRLGAEKFLRHPSYAYEIWDHYNRAILAFHRRHADRSLLVSANALLRQPGRLLRLARERLGVEIDEIDVSGLIDSERPLAELGGDDPLIRWIAGASPNSVNLLAKLDEAADISGRDLWRSPAEPDPAPTELGGAPDPVISIVLPCLDHGQFLIEAIASVETVETAWEIVVVNDGSSEPRTLEILELVKRRGHRVIDQENRGLSAARNRGVEAARGHYVLALDCDNRLRAGFIDEAVRVLDRTPRMGVVYGTWQEFGMRSRLRRPPDFDLDRLLTGNYIDTCAVFRKVVWAEVGGFDPDVVTWEDWEFWISAAERGWRFHRLDSVCFDYRVRPGSLVTAMADPAARERVVSRVVEKHAELYARFRERRFGVLESWLNGIQRDRERLASELDASRVAPREAREALSASERRIDALRADLSRAGKEGSRRRLSRE